MRFEIKEGSGKGVFQGVKGYGWMRVGVMDGECAWLDTGEDLRDVRARKWASGFCGFEGCGGVGGGLV